MKGKSESQRRQFQWIQTKILGDAEEWNGQWCWRQQKDQEDKDQLLAVNSWFW